MWIHSCIYMQVTKLVCSRFLDSRPIPCCGAGFVNYSELVLMSICISTARSRIHDGMTNNCRMFQYPSSTLSCLYECGYVCMPVCMCTCVIYIVHKACTYIGRYVLTHYVRIIVYTMR